MAHGFQALKQAFDVCLIPYRPDHPFNRVCCPTKIMDYMGTGRPIVSTALPECRLYGHLFDVVEDADRFIDAVGTAVSGGRDTDSNGATVGSVYGALHGISSIPVQLIGTTHVHVRSAVRDFDRISIDELAERTIRVMSSAAVRAECPSRLPEACRTRSTRWAT